MGANVTSLRCKRAQNARRLTEATTTVAGGLARPFKMLFQSRFRIESAASWSARRRQCDRAWPSQGNTTVAFQVQVEDGGVHGGWLLSRVSNYV